MWSHVPGPKPVLGRSSSLYQRSAEVTSCVVPRQLSHTIFPPCNRKMKTACNHIGELLTELKGQIPTWPRLNQSTTDSRLVLWSWPAIYFSRRRYYEPLGRPFTTEDLFIINLTFLLEKQFWEHSLRMPGLAAPWYQCQKVDSEAIWPTCALLCWQMY